MEFWLTFGRFLVNRRELILQRLYEHIWISGIAILVTALLALPLGILITRHRKLAGYVINTTSMLYTIPSLALFGFFIPFLGIGVRPALVALIIYGLLPLVRNTYVGISEVDPAMIEAAEGMGTTGLQRLFLVELPLAFPVIVAGFRTMTVMTISVATIATFIGAGGLGSLIMRGINTVDNVMIMAGAIPVALLAIAAEFTLGYVEKRLRSKMAPLRG